ncbi:MAG: STAS domain-containing protein [Brumimicrobium sp.]
MNFQVTDQNKYSVVSSHVDKLNAGNAPELKSALVNLNKNSVNNIIIDLSETSYCDSSGLSAILTANRLCKDSGGKFILCGLQPNVNKMIEISQLNRVLNIEDDLDSAVKSI